MNLLLVGHSVLDKILTGKNEITKPGGIYYSIFGVSLLVNENDRIKLVTQLDEASNKYFERMFGKFDNTHVGKVPKIPTVQLEIFKDKERVEKYLNFTNKIDISSLSAEDIVDGILINMITGNDIDYNDLAELRIKYNATIYLDIHSLAKELDELNKMQLRRVPDVEKWLENIDILQANELEAKAIIGNADELKIAEFVLSDRPRIFIITKGEKGAEVYYKSGNEIKSLYCNPVIGKTINKVGCGDIFGAVFFYNYLLNRNIQHSAKLANTIAGLSTKTNSEEDLIVELINEKILK